MVETGYRQLRALLARANPIARLRRRLIDFAVGLLTKQLKGYTVAVPNALPNLKQHIRPGDVVLIEGNERISECIKYLTQSSWSHSALYVGDEPLRGDPELARKLIDQWGDDANFLLVEALVESGVVFSPLSKYTDFNLRVCRPFNLAADDRRELISFALKHVGDTYDLRNVFDLARYFLPVSLVPQRYRHKALHFGSGEPTRVICSSLIAESFYSIKFPIVPSFDVPPQSDGGRPRLLKRWRPDVRRWGVLRQVPPGLVTPRDFDLSPYFAIIKFNVIEGIKFDYRRLQWAEDDVNQAEPRRMGVQK